MIPAPPTVGLDAFPFQMHWDVVGIVLALAIGYGYSIRVLAGTYAPPGEQAVTRRQIAWFVTALVVLFAVETWPIHDVGEQSLFMAHMVEHMALAFIVPPALLKGMPSWLLRLVVKPVLPVLRFLTRPVLAILFFNAVLAFIHVPSVMAAMLRSEPVHLGLHVVLLASAVIMWWPVIGPIPDLARLRPEAAMGYLFLQSLVPTIPASFLTFGQDVIYKTYETLPRLWGIDALSDQLVAGLIMKIGGGIILWTAIAVIFFRWAADEERSGAVHTGASRALSG